VAVLEVDAAAVAAVVALLLLLHACRWQLRHLHTMQTLRLKTTSNWVDSMSLHSHSFDHGFRLDFLSQRRPPS
jgi:outer membrane lipopolysaccharide assembly protein LptE/RlpB